jgi:hypothetical protein
MTISFANTHKYARFGSGSVILESRNEQPLSLDAIRANVPSVLATQAHSSRSERYQFISTFDMIQGLEKEGFYPHHIMQGGSRDKEKRGYTKHLIRFRQGDMVGRAGTTYEICLLGSHDGTTSWQMYGGVYRALCKNGNIYFEDQAVQVKLPHKGNILDKVIEGAFTVLDQKQLAYDRVDQFRAIDLNRDEQMAFANAASILRFGEEEPAPVQAVRLLEARRTGDQGSDLWTVQNRVQENVIRGGISYTGTRRRQDGSTQVVHASTRPVRSVDGDVKLNRALWTLAAEMAKIKSAA